MGDVVGAILGDSVGEVVGDSVVSVVVWEVVWVVVGVVISQLANVPSENACSASFKIATVPAQSEPSFK